MLAENSAIAKPQPSDDGGGDWPGCPLGGQDGSKRPASAGRFNVDHFRAFAQILEHFDAYRRFYS